jgi:hypothetical protein
LHILWSTGIFPPVLVCMLHQEKSGNPEWEKLLSSTSEELRRRRLATSNLRYVSWFCLRANWSNMASTRFQLRSCAFLSEHR